MNKVTLSLKIAVSIWLMVFGFLLAEEVFYFDWTRSSEYEWLTVLAIGLTTFGWFLADARERNFTASWPLKIAVAGFGVFAVLYYKFRYFGVGAGFRFLGIVVVAIVVVALAATAVEMMIPGYVA